MLLRILTRSDSRIPTGNAVKKRYEKYFVGQVDPGEAGTSLVELGDTMMEIAATGLRRTPSAIAEDVKGNYFKRR